MAQHLDQHVDQIADHAPDEATAPWLTADQLRAWLGLVSVAELLPVRLDQQLQRDAGLTHFEYMVLAMLSEAPDRTLRMTMLAARTDATLPRLSHVVRRLEERGLVARSSCPSDGRATNATLSDEGYRVVVGAAPGHVREARRLVVDALDATQIAQLEAITQRLLERLDPDRRFCPDRPATPDSPH
ncbi:MarR family winged helix-turn-helix transcriptional regulator [Cellulomonas composti]|uniref:MarR family transcriptional regulator n=1 Tax=Cellulomonas composti TaxID=266130 RepID=A0A511J9G3_9CELL|nr:MarR family transcriptional regulator [Cellulomonas composti]GEL94620.1 MarR family transcriptional regulator [Cellulomonas composti]